MAQIAAQLQGNMQMMGSNVPLSNSTYMMPQPFTSPTMFSQMTGMVGNMFGPEAGGIAQLAGQIITSPTMRGFMPGLSGAVSDMMRSMPIGGGADPGNFMYAQLQGRLGKSVPRGITLPADFSSQASIDLYNEQVAQFNEFTSRNQTGTASGMAGLKRFTQGGADSPHSLGVQLANVQTLRQSSRFQDVFSLFEAVRPDQKLDDPELKALIDLAAQDTPQAAEKAKALLEANPHLEGKAKSILNTARNATGLGNLAMTLSGMISSGGIGGAEAGALQGLGDMLMSLTGIDKDPTQFSAAAIQSMSMMGALGTSTIIDPTTGRRVMAADRIVGGLMGNLENAKSPYAATRDLGARRSGQLLQELTKSGLLTTGGVDTMGSLSIEDVQKMEKSIAQQLEGFSEIAKAGRRIGLQVNEVVQTMQGLYGGRFGEQLANAAGQEYVQAKAAFTGPINEDTDRFLRAEAQRKAGATMMQQVEKAVQIGRYAGFDARGSLAVMQTAGQLAEDLGMGREAGMQMGMSAMGRMKISRDMGMPMDPSQALAMSRDIMAKGANNPSVQAFASMKLAIEAGVLKETDVQDLLADFRSGKDIDPGEVNKRLSAIPGVNLAAFTGREAVARGMTFGAGDINLFYATNENVNVTGALKRAFTAANIDPEQLVSKIAKSQAGMLGEAFGMTATEAGQLDFTQFTAKFNQIGSQAERISLVNRLVDAGTITQEEGNQMLSNLGTMTDRFGVASDRGAFRTARIRQAEEAERQRHGGFTTVELKAGAIVANEAMINEAFKSIGGGDLQKGLTQGLKDIREQKITDRMKAEGISRSVAEKAVDDEGFTLPELLKASSGVTEPGMQKAVEVGLANVNQELKLAEKTDNKAKIEQLQMQKADLEEYRDALESGDKDRIEQLRVRAEQSVADQKHVTDSAKTEQQKKQDAVQQAAIDSHAELKQMRPILIAIAENVGVSSESLRNLDKNISGA